MVPAVAVQAHSADSGSLSAPAIAFIVSIARPSYLTVFSSCMLVFGG